jgi:hypothetical protein
MAPQKSSFLKNWVESPSWFRAFLIGVALCASAFLANVALSEVRPYNVWGLTYGTAAAVLMAMVALYGLRRRTTNAALKLRLGRAQAWLLFHLYAGALCLLLTLMHSGFHVPKGILTWWLWVLSIWVTVSGLFGALLQKWIPTILASGLGNEVLYERIPDLIKEIKDKAKTLAETCADPVWDFYKKNLARALEAPQTRLIYYMDVTGGIQSRMKQFEYLRRLLSPEERDKLNKLEALYKTKLEIDAHFTLQKTLRGWLYLHVPVSLALLVLVAFHIFTILYY